MVTAVRPPFGYYVVTTNAQKYFAKVLPDMEVGRHIEADEVARYLADAGISAATLRGIKKANEYSIVLYDFVPFRFGVCREDDAKKLGVTLGEAHKALKSAPFGFKVREQGLKRFAVLFNRLEQIKVPPEFSADFKVLAADLKPAFSEKADAQPIHGDLNLTNILFPLDLGEPILIDFEDALVSWLPPKLDVAMALQRLCLVADATPADIVAAARALIGGYVNHADVRVFEDHRDLQSALLWLSFRSLCLLAELEAAGADHDVGEWRKFVGLAHRAKRDAPLLKAIVDA